MNAQKIMNYIVELENKIDELEDKLQEKTYELEDLKDEMQQQSEYYHDNYKEIDSYEFYGVSRRDFV